MQFNEYLFYFKNFSTYTRNFFHLSPQIEYKIVSFSYLSKFFDSFIRSFLFSSSSINFAKFLNILSNCPDKKPSKIICKDFSELYDKLANYAKVVMKEFEWYQDVEEGEKSLLPGSYAVFGLG